MPDSDAPIGKLRVCLDASDESGDGYSDILAETEGEEIGIIIELKYAENARLEAACEQALA